MQIQKVYTGGQIDRGGPRDTTMNDWVYAIGDIPFVDLDFVGIAFDQLEPVAIIDWKHSFAKRSNKSKSSLEALRRLAVKADLPFFVVFWETDMSWFTVYGRNDSAQNMLAGQDRHTPREMVALLFRMSGRTAPADVLERYSNEYPASLLKSDAASTAEIDNLLSGGSK